MSYQPHLKRLIDLFLVLLSLPISLPLFALLCLINAFAFSGKAFFLQERLGLNNRIFILIKFRSISSDQKISSWSRLLRSTGLDELPQVINVLIGHMSLVGPRPLLVEYEKTIHKKYVFRLLLKPGLTGLAQVKGRNSISWEEKFSWDAKYFEQISFLTDLKILIHTVPALFKSSSDPGNLNQVENLNEQKKQNL